VGYLESVSANNVFVSDDIAFACEDDCVMVDVSAPTAPVLLGPLGQPDSGNGHEAFAVGDTVYAAGIFGLHVYDISDIASPEEIGYLELPATPEAIWVEGRYAYLAHDQSGLVIADISDPFAPTLAGELVATLDGRDVHVKDGFAYLAANDDGVRIVDVRDPSAPEEVGSYVADYEVRVVRADGDKVYIGGEIDGVLMVLDAADPTAPTPLYTDDYFFVHDLKVQQNVIYIVSGISGMAAFEITVCD
jgi:hypothetical protein